MKRIQVKTLNAEEREVLTKGLRSSLGFTVRRSQILLMSADEKLTAQQVSERLRCSDQCVREAIHAFEQEGISCLQPRSRARHDQQSAFDEKGRERLKAIIQQSPRQFGYESSLWTLQMLATQAAKEGLTAWEVDEDTVGRTLKQAGVDWQRAKHWIKSPDPHYAEKKTT
jgi:transposase